MPSDADIEARFWKELKSSPFMMLGLDGERDGHVQPMTARHEGDSGPLWFFTATDNSLVDALGHGNRAIATYASKGHDLFASIHGSLSLVTDRDMINRLWNSSAAPWFKGGRDDPKLALIRLDTERAEIWLSSSTTGAAITRLFTGKDPKEEAKENVAEVAL
jgi:general stress protein 26